MGGRPFAFADAGFAFAFSVAAGFFRASASLSDEFSGEKMLFFLALFAVVFEFLFCVELPLVDVAFARTDFGFELLCSCCCFTTDGGALPPVDAIDVAAFALLLFAFDAIVFFLISFCTRFDSLTCALVGVESSSLE